MEIREITGKYIKTIAMDLVVVIVALAYVFYQMVTLEKSQLNPLVLIAQALMGIICGIIIKVSLGENGFSKGYNSNIWLEEEKKYNEACSNSVDYIDERLENYYLCKEIEKKELYRRKNLQAVRLKYSTWFDSDGNFIGTKEQIKKLKLYQKLVLNKCVRVRVYPLNLFSEYANTSEQDTKREPTDKTQRAKNVAKNSISAVLVAMIGVYFIPLFNWNWASLISSTMQVSMWIMFGILQLYTNYNFVVREKVAVLRKKKEEMVIFVKNCDKGMYRENPYLQQDKVIETNKEKCDNNDVQNVSVGQVA